MGQSGRTIVVGDVHGCWDELHDLLDRVGFGAHDRLVGIGDLVDRGPDSPRVLEFFAESPNAVSIQGNHERKHVRSALGKTSPALSQVIVRRQLGERYERWIPWMDALPRYLELDDAMLVHGFWEPGVSVEDQDERVLVGTMGGEKRLDERLSASWYELYDGKKPLVVGHRDYLRTGEPLVRDGRVYAIDTGCVHGGRLTAVLLPGFEIVSVPARANHWFAMQEKWGPVVGAERDPLDLDWKTLADHARAIHDPSLPEEAREKATRCARLADEADRTVGEVVGFVRRRTRELVDELTSRAGWTDRSERERAKRFAREVEDEPIPSLFYHARRGTLDADVVRRRAKNARKLRALAEALDLQHGFRDGRA